MNENDMELLALYRLLREVLPLARQTLTRGVPLDEQEAFWEAYREASLYADLDEEDAEGPSGMMTRIEALERNR
jgi:hypothetical protein